MISKKISQKIIIHNSFLFYKGAFHNFPTLEPSGFTTIQKKQGNHRKSYMVIYENIKLIESTIEVYGNTQVIKRPWYDSIQIMHCTYYSHGMEKHARIFSYYDNVF